MGLCLYIYYTVAKSNGRYVVTENNKNKQNEFLDISGYAKDWKAEIEFEQSVVF